MKSKHSHTDDLILLGVVININLLNIKLIRNHTLLIFSYPRS